MNPSIKEAIDRSVLAYLQQRLKEEYSKEIEETPFFGSYTMGVALFQEATQNLKAKKEAQDRHTLWMFKPEALSIIDLDKLPFGIEDEPHFSYLLDQLLQAQILINEAIVEHFSTLCTRAHDRGYLEEKRELLERLLREE